MIRLIATLGTAVLVVYLAGRVADGIDTEAWRAGKEALRGRLAQATRAVSAAAEEAGTAEAEQPGPSLAPPPAEPPPPEARTPTLSTDAGEVDPPSEPVDAASRPDARGRIDTERVRQRLDRVMTLAAGARR